MAKERLFVDPQKIHSDVQLIIAKYDAWERTPEEQRPKDIQKQCIMSIEFPNNTRWSDYLEALLKEAERMGFGVSQPHHVHDIGKNVVLKCFVEKAANAA